MRPTTSTMLQQNNNNNYPCLNMTGSTRELLQKCSRASLPFPSRLELGLADLPLIRGLRAWALCSKNRRKAGGLLGGGQAPTAPPAGRAGTTSCTRPADVYLSGEWGRMGYGLPLGVDAGQAGIGALVTVATLKTSEGSGKTQTQCLFLRTEKGSCLYSTAKPGSGLTTSAASSVVGGWLRGKTGGGGPAGRRDSGPTLPSQTGANRVRVRSGRRWRKSCNASGREKGGANRERQQSSREDPAGEIILEERQEERDKGGLESEQFPSVQQDSSRARQEKEGACTSPKCCHNDSPKACSQCGSRAQRGDSQDGQEGDERRGVPNSEVKGMRKERQENAEEEEEERELESSNSVMAAPNPDLESNHLHPESHSGCDVEEIREANEELKTQTSHSKTDTNSEVMKIRSGNKDFIQGQSAQVTPGGNGDFDEELEANVNGFNDHVEADQESVEETESVDVEKEGDRVSQAPAEVSAGFVSDSTCPASISAAAAREPSAPVEGSTCSVDHESCVQREQEDSQDNHTKRRHQGVLDPGIVGKEELDVSRLEPREPNCVADENITVNDVNVNKSSQAEERGASPSPLRHRDPSLFETGRTIVTEINCSTTELNGAEHRDDLLRENRAEESQEENIEARVNPEAGGEAGEVRRSELHDGDGEKRGDSNTQEDDGKEVMRNCALEESWRLQESADGCRGRKEEVGDTSVAHENVTNVARADHTTSAALSPANPAPSLPPLGSMATGLPCLEAEREEEEEEEEKGVVVTAGDGEGSREGKRRLEGEEERGSTVATEEGGDKEEEEEEDEFGVFMQAEGEPAWSEGSTMSASVPCGSRESAALGNHAITGESTHWTPGWTDSSSDQSDDTWTAFPQDSPDEGQDVVGQWWTTSTVDDSRDRLLANQNLAAAFAEAFPSLPGSSSSDLDTVPTLTQLLRGRASQDQGLLDSFHDLNKMICQRYKRANGVSRDLLLRTLHLERTNPESRPAPRTANRRLSPGLPSANQHAQNAAAKRRLSCDYNRNIME